MVKHLSTMQETWVQSLVWEDSLEKEKATHSSILAWRIPWAVSVTKSQTQLSNFPSLTHSQGVNKVRGYAWGGRALALTLSKQVAFGLLVTGP